MTNGKTIKPRVYYGVDPENMTHEDGTVKTILAMVTGEMVDGTLVYTEVETTKDGVIVRDENGEPKLILDNQYTRRTRHGWQTFHRI